PQLRKLLLDQLPRQRGVHCDLRGPWLHGHSLARPGSGPRCGLTTQNRWPVGASRTHQRLTKAIGLAPSASRRGPSDSRSSDSISRWTRLSRSAPCTRRSGSASRDSSSRYPGSFVSFTFLPSAAPQKRAAAATSLVLQSITNVLNRLRCMAPPD